MAIILIILLPKLQGTWHSESRTWLSHGKKNTLYDLSVEFQKDMFGFQRKNPMTLDEIKLHEFHEVSLSFMLNIFQLPVRSRLQKSLILASSGTTITKIVQLWKRNWCSSCNSRSTTRLNNKTNTLFLVSFKSVLVYTP